MITPLRRSETTAASEERGASYSIRDPAGREIFIPARAEEDFAYFRADRMAEIRDYWTQQGYVVVRDLIPREYCRQAMAWFEAEVMPSDKYIYRQATANPERHEFTRQGFVLNPILNVQSLDGRRYGNFRNAGLETITHPNLQYVIRELLGEDGKLVQSMYFHGNSETWAHQDTYYLDAEETGRMIGAWFALEDISPGAGRFFVYPRSHRMDFGHNAGAMDVAFHHDRYKAHVVDGIGRMNLICHAPALRQGDVLFWTSKTLHGSLETRQPERSRSSFTAHYIPDSSRFVQFQTRLRKLNLHEVGGMRVHKPKDLDRSLNRIVLQIETSFPAAFRLAKKIAIKVLTH